MSLKQNCEDLLEVNGNLADQLAAAENLKESSVNDMQLLNEKYAVVKE